MHFVFELPQANLPQVGGFCKSLREECHALFLHQRYGPMVEPFALPSDTAPTSVAETVLLLQRIKHNTVSPLGLDQVCAGAIIQVLWQMGRVGEAE